MQVGIDSFAAAYDDASLAVSPSDRLRALRLGYDVAPLVYVEGFMRSVRLAAAASLPDCTHSAATLTISVPFYSWNEGPGLPYVPGRDSLATLGTFLLQGGSPSYFKTVGTRILRGRPFLPTDGVNTERVAVISQSMANGVWPGEDALGKQFRLGADTSGFITVVGIAEDMRGRQIRGADELWYYLPIAQAAIGLYSVIAYAVAQRTRELGVRIEMGASSGTVIRMIVGQGVIFRAGWRRDRQCHRLGEQPMDRAAAVRRVSTGSGGLFRGGGGVADRRRGRIGEASDPRDASRSERCAAERLTATQIGVVSFSVG